MCYGHTLHITAAATRTKGGWRPCSEVPLPSPGSSSQSGSWTGDGAQKMG